MATGILAAPTAEWRGTGPCINDCDHLDCAAIRRMAESACAICLAPIGYNRRYYEHRLGLAHAECVDKQYQGDHT